MMPEDKPRAAHRGTERGVDADMVKTAQKMQPSSIERCEALLKVLCRDDALRRSYVRQRWQGVVRE